jgi:uncharacterized protein (TIGR02145 family)
MGTMIDIDGNVYNTVVIGDQEWTIENFRCTKFNDNTAIPNVTSNSAWAELTTPGYCFYLNRTDPALQKEFGALYNWYAISHSKIAPVGWRAPFGN